MSARDRWIALSCLGAALVVAVGSALFFPYATFSAGIPLSLYVVLLLGALPSAAALVACVLTRLPLVAFSIGVAAALVGSLLGMAAFVAQGGPAGIGVSGIGGVVLTSVLGAVPLVAADLLARRGPFTALWGALAGLLVGALRTIIPLVMVGVGSFGRTGGASYAVIVTTAEVLVPVVVLTTAGAIAGWRAQTTRAGRAPEV